MGVVSDSEKCHKNYKIFFLFFYINTGHSRYVDFAYLETTTYVEVIFHSQHFFSIFLCISTPSMSKMVNTKQRVSRGDFLYFLLYLLVSMSKSAFTRGAIFSATAMYLY